MYVAYHEANNSEKMGTAIFNGLPCRYVAQVDRKYRFCQNMSLTAQLLVVIQ